MINVGSEIIVGGYYFTGNKPQTVYEGVYRFSGGVWNRLKIRINSEKIGKIRENSEKFWKVRKNLEKFGKIWKNLEKFRKNRGTKHKKWGNLWSLEAARASRARPEGGGSHVWPRGGTYIPYIPSTNSQEGVQSKNFSGGGVVLFFLPRGGTHGHTLPWNHVWSYKINPSGSFMKTSNK